MPVSIDSFCLKGINGPTNIYEDEMKTIRAFFMTPIFLKPFEKTSGNQGGNNQVSAEDSGFES